MELINQLTHNQLTMYIPVALVLVCAILVFAFGFKSAELPAFDKLSGISDDRKPAGKKRKTKEKVRKIFIKNTYQKVFVSFINSRTRSFPYVSLNPIIFAFSLINSVHIYDSIVLKKVSTTNGNISNSTTAKGDKSPTKRSPVKEVSEVTKPKEKKAETTVKQVEKTKKVEKPKIVEEIKTKKTVKSKNNEKPVDFDEGTWEKVPTKSDKKKKQDSPSKKEKKPKKNEKPVENSKVVIEVVNKDVVEQSSNIETKPKEQIVVPAPPAKQTSVKVTVEVVQEKKEKKKEKKPKKDVVAVKAEAETEPDTVVAKIADAMKESVVKENTPKEKTNEGGVAFDELGGNCFKHF